MKHINIILIIIIKKSDLYSNVVWIKTQKQIYILDFEVISKNKDKYITVFDDIANSFKENN